MGGGADGEGAKAPSPVSAFNVLASPTPPGLRPPPPPRGAGAVVAIPGESRIRESKPTRQLPLQALPHTLDRGRHPHGGRGRRGGGKSPLPCLCIQYTDVSLSRAEWHQRSQRNTPRGSLLSMCWHPPPRPASGLLPRPEGRGQSWRYPGKGRTRGASPYTGPWGVSPRGVGQTGRGQKPPPLSLHSICADVSLPRAGWHQRSQRNTP
jgi:hypothetical protein